MLQYKTQHYLSISNLTYPLTHPQMQINKQLSSIFHLTQDGFIICTGINYKSIIKNTYNYPQAFQILSKIINTLGQLSATSQALKQIITTLNKFIGTNQRIYIKTVGSEVMGFIKTGEKNLFYRDIIGNIKQLQPICVLDIYVHQSCQRNGYGKEIFQKFLQTENILPDKLAYDRPSSKLISFLKKHYQLSQYVPQNNNYVIFNRFFTTNNQNQNTIQNRQNTKYQSLYSRSKLSQYGQKQNKQHKSMIQATNKTQPNTNIQKQKQNTKPKQMIDSLQIYTQQVQRNKGRITTLPPSLMPKIQQINPYQTSIQRNIINYKLPPSNTFQINGKYALNMKLRQMSYKVPWATENQQKKTTFRTTSNAYGNSGRY